MENILFKISFPAEFHAQTAVEAAIILDQEMRQLGKDASQIERVVIRTQEPAMRIIDKQGPLNNPADRDHCIQYMVAVPLLFGRLTADDYQDRVAADPRIDSLRAKMICTEHAPFTADYYDPDKRSIANGLTLHFADGSSLGEVLVQYPLGHRRRRDEGIPHLLDKFRKNIGRRLETGQQAAILNASLDFQKLAAAPVSRYVDLYVV